METAAFRRRLPWFGVVFMVCHLTGAQNTNPSTTDPAEARALSAIFARWGITATSAWNISGDLCSGAAIDSTPIFYSDYESRNQIALGTWVFSIAGALIAIPIGIKRKSLGPLVFFGTTGTMVDIIVGITACEREHAERQKMMMSHSEPPLDSDSES